jgi:hypothetical protein
MVETLQHGGNERATVERGGAHAHHNIGWFHLVGLLINAQLIIKYELVYYVLSFIV